MVGFGASALGSMNALEEQAVAYGLVAMDTTFDAPQGEVPMEDSNLDVEDITDAVDVAILGEATATDSSLAVIGKEPARFDQSEIAMSDDDSSLSG